jgi:hypothetical protein
MVCMIETRARHSGLGIASVVLSFFPGMLWVGMYALIQLAVSAQPPGADTVGYAFQMLMLTVFAALFELAALGLGIAGAFQRRRKRLFATLGVACSMLVLVYINSQVGFANVASFVAGMTEPQPKVHVVSPGNE